MKNQKICIIGGGITGLVTAISLSNLNCGIDLIINDSSNKQKSNRTIGISENNFNFLNNLNITKLLKKEIWTCSVMKLYTKNKDKTFSEIFELNHENKKEKILYMIKNSTLEKLILSKINKTKSISIKKIKKVSLVPNSEWFKSVKLGSKIFKYDLVIICTGYNSSIVKNLLNNHKIENSYGEIAITTILSHDAIENRIVRQIFLDDEIFALLPISKTKTSIVWSVKSDMKKNNDSFLKRRIKIYADNYLKNIKFETKIEYKDLNFFIRNKYYLERTLLFGDALHVIHPFVGQGFNMTLRDLASLKKILSDKINLGLDIGSSDVLSEFSKETKSRNFIFSISTDILRNSIPFKKSRDDVLKILNKSKFAKNIFFNIADKGLRF